MNIMKNNSMKKSVTPTKKNITNRSKTPTKNNTPKKTKSPASSTISINRSHISQCRSRGQKFSSELDILQKQLTNNKNKLCSCLQIYSILDGNMQNQRCLQHNNTLSLYCLNERRILCVNCLYGMHKHRSHKVIPLKDCMQMVNQDNQKLNSLVQQQIKRLDYYSKIMHENQIILETEMHRTLVTLQNEYKKHLEKLQSQYKDQKQSILQNFQPIIRQCSDVKVKIDDFRYKVFEVYSKYENIIPIEGVQDKQIMKQIIFVTIMELCQIHCRTINKSQLDQLSRKNRTNFSFKQ